MSVVLRYRDHGPADARRDFLVSRSLTRARARATKKINRTPTGGRSPYRRATAETFAPPANDSATIRPLSSCDHARRPPTPVITSSRRTPTIPFGSNVGSKLRTNRSPKTAEIVVRRRLSERAVTAPLTAY